MSEPYAIPDRVPGCPLTLPSSGRHGSLQFINPACFTLANPLNVLGNLGRNTVTGPGLVNVDYSMVKNTKIPRISESFNVQFRAEFFNLFNHANFSPPVANLDVLSGPTVGAPPFGQITSTQTPERQVQFGLKIIW
jgi:hypothetical protein